MVLRAARVVRVTNDAPAGSPSPWLAVATLMTLVGIGLSAAAVLSGRVLPAIPPAAVYAAYGLSLLLLAGGGIAAYAQSSGDPEERRHGGAVVLGVTCAVIFAVEAMTLFVFAAV
jgi:hypothetical protein